MLNKRERSRSDALPRPPLEIPQGDPMSVYFHATNLRMPFDPVDLEFLALLGDYRLGEPLPNPPTKEQPQPLSQADLILGGVAGLYTTRMALKAEEVRKRTGWGESFQLGPPWRPFGEFRKVL